MQNIYLDNAALTFIDPEILKTVQEFYSTKYGNTSSLHSLGIKSKIAFDKAKKETSEQLNCTPQEIIFTSGGTESNNLTIFGIAEAYKEKGKHIISTKIEHKSILEPLKKLEKQGYKIDYLNINKEGQIDLNELKSLITDETILVSIIYANNEIGSIQDLKEINQITKEKGTLLHTDACQATNYLKLDTKDLGIDLMSINSGKIHGPYGTGLLYIKSGTQISPQILGGSLAQNKRSGTINLPNTIGFSKALKTAQENIENNYKHAKKLQTQLESQILKEIPGAQINNNFKNRLPNISNIAFPKLNNKELLLILDSMGIYVSTGSACNEGKNQNSYVLENIKISPDLLSKSLRLSIGKFNKNEDIDYTISCLKKIFTKMNN